MSLMNKKVISAVSAAAALTLAAMSVSAEGKSSLVVLGDSITTGYGLEGYVSGDNSSAKDSFANRLSEGFSDYQNLAVDGRTSAQLLESFSDEATLTAVENADTIVISIGGNDFLSPMMAAIQMSFMTDQEFMKGITEGTVTEEEMMEKFSEMDLEGIAVNAANSVDTAVTGQNIDGVLDKINELSPDCDVYILTVYDPFEGADGSEAFAEAAEELLDKLNGEITRSAASHEGVTVIDVKSAFSGHALEYTNISEMDIHPNKAGHGVIFDLLSAEILSDNVGEVAEAAASEEEQPAAENNGYDEALLAAVQDVSPVSDSSTAGADTGNTSPAAYAATAVIALFAAGALLGVRCKK